MSIDLTHVETSRATIENNLSSSTTDAEKLNNLYGELNIIKKDLSDLLFTVRSHANSLDEKQQTAIINQMVLIYGTANTVVEFVHPLITGDPQTAENLKKAQLITTAQGIDSTASSIEALCRTVKTTATLSTLTTTMDEHCECVDKKLSSALRYSQQIDSQIKAINQSY
jgi:hypothetical protein